MQKIKVQTTTEYDVTALASGYSPESVAEGLEFNHLRIEGLRVVDSDGAQVALLNPTTEELLASTVKPG